MSLTYEIILTIDRRILMAGADEADVAECARIRFAHEIALGDGHDMAISEYKPKPDEEHKVLRP